jgi:AraC-like DNA-binding protein
MPYDVAANREVRATGIGAEAPDMRDLTKIPTIRPEIFSSSGPLPPFAGPVRFLLGDRPERERRELLHNCFARLDFRHQVDGLHNVPFHVDLSLHLLPGLHMALGKMHGSRNWRTREMLANGHDDFVLTVNLGGPYVVSLRDEEIVLEDGEATFVPCSEPCSFAHYPPGGVVALRFPRAPFASLVANVDDCYLRRIPRTTPALSLLTNYVLNARDEQTVANRVLQHLMVSHVYDLMAVAIGATRDAEEAARGRGLRAARLLAIKQDIAKNLEGTDLSVTALAERHNCTPRFVQRLFEAEGTTLTEYVLVQRLARAHRMLVDPRRDGHKISAVAYDCGFGDLSYFNRVFRRQYGTAPSDIRAQARQDAPGSNSNIVSFASSRSR